MIIMRDNRDKMSVLSPTLKPIITIILQSPWPDCWLGTTNWTQPNNGLQSKTEAIITEVSVSSCEQSMEGMIRNLDCKIVLVILLDVEYSLESSLQK